MKYTFALCILLLGMHSGAQTTTTVRSQGNNYGNGGAYVAPVTTKTYTTPAAANTPYSAPAKTYNYNSGSAAVPGSAASPAAPTSSGAGSNGGSYKAEESRPDFGIKFKTKADLSMDQAIKEHDWDAVFKLFELPDYEFEARAGGGKSTASYNFISELSKVCLIDYSSLPMLYKAIYTKKLYYSYPVFSSVMPQYFVVDLSATEFMVNNACLYLGDYQLALTNFRSHTMYGARKPLIKKKNESYAGEYDKQEQARQYINYMAGRCFQELGMADSAKKYLALGQGFEIAWERLYSAGATARATRNKQ